MSEILNSCEGIKQVEGNMFDSVPQGDAIILKVSLFLK